jgi:hypothetical protein
VAVVAPVAVAVPIVGAPATVSGEDVTLIPAPIVIPDPNMISAIFYFPLYYLSGNKKRLLRAFCFISI